MTEKFTHNLRIAVMNPDDGLLSEAFTDEILSKVYAEIANKVIRKEVYWSGSGDAKRSKVDFAVLWNRKKLKNKIEMMCMGDLFTTSMVCDSLLLSATDKILWSIGEIIKKEEPDMDKKWTIVYHISKLLDAPPNYRDYDDILS